LKATQAELEQKRKKHPDQRTGRLDIRMDALASRVLFEPGSEGLRATTVEYLKGERLYGAHPDLPGKPSVPRPPLESLGRHMIRARREVILAGGAFNTPQLLMLSGIGPPEELARHGITVVLPRPGVGGNLQDRYEICVVSKMQGDFPILKNAGFLADLQKDPLYKEWHEKRTGLYTSNGAVIGILKRSTEQQPDPDLFIFGIAGYFKGYYRGYSTKTVKGHDYFTWAILKGHHTRNCSGRLTLRSADPRDVPDIVFRYFDDDPIAPAGDWQEDLDALAEGIEFVRRMNADPGLRRYIGSELIPGPAASTRAKLREFIKREAWGHHASCTCKIGAGDDGLAVLDSEFRVRGTENLRVVDASIFPRVPGLFIVSAVYMISEKATDVILASAKKADASSGRKP
jgi:choline dehydrogenase